MLTTSSISKVPFTGTLNVNVWDKTSLKTQTNQVFDDAYLNLIERAAKEDKLILSASMDSFCIRQDNGALFFMFNGNELKISQQGTLPFISVELTMNKNNTSQSVLDRATELFKNTLDTLKKKYE